MAVKENQSDNPFEHGRRFILYISIIWLKIVYNIL